MNRSTRRGHLLACLLIVSALLLSWGGSLRTPFLFLDDYYHVLALQKEPVSSSARLLNTYSTERFSNDEIEAYLPWWLPVSQFKFHYFRPLASYSLKMDRLLWGKDPIGFHLTGLVLHVSSCLLMYALAVSLGAAWNVGVLIALIGGLHTENIFNVTWISCRDILLSFFLFLLCCLCFQRFLSGGSRRLLFGATSFILFILGVLCKELLVLTPVVLLGMSLLAQHHAGRVGLLRLVGRALRDVLPFLLFSLAYTAWYAFSGHGVNVGYITVSWSHSLVSNLVVMARTFVVPLLSLFFSFTLDPRSTAHPILRSSGGRERCRVWWGFLSGSAGP